MDCIYLRKSRADLELEARGEMETLARHRKALLELAKKLNRSIGDIYEEIVSGETIESRPVVRQLLDEVEQGKWSGVLVMEVERLARGDTIDQGVVARAFKIGGAKIITPTKTYDPNNEFDEEYFEFGLFMSRREYKAINRRIQRGRVASAKEGKFLGATPPYGYDKVRIVGDKGYTLAPHPEESEIVKYIYSQYTQGSGMGVLARSLDMMGVKPRNRDTWSKSTISDILSNPVYIGKLRWSHRIEQKYMEDGKVRKRRTINEDAILVDGLHSGLITEDVFDAAQQVRKQNTHKKTKEGLALQNPLSGIVYCRLCGHMMTRLGQSQRNAYDTLRCSNRYCKNVSAPIFLIERKIIDTLTVALDKYQIELAGKTPKTNEKDIAALRKILSSLKSESEKIDLQISTTYDLLEQGIYTVDVFTQRNAELAERRASTLSQIEKTAQEIQEFEQLRDETHLAIPQMIKSLEAYAEAKTPSEKNLILRELLERVEYQKDKANTRGNLLNDNFEVHLFPRHAHF